MQNLHLKLSILWVSFLIIGKLQAQKQPRSPDTLAAREARFLQHQLALSKEQQKQVEEELKRYQQKLQVNREWTTNQDKAVRVAQIKELVNEHHGILKRILTMEQWKIYEAGVEKNKASFLQHAKEKKIKVEEFNE